MPHFLASPRFGNIAVLRSYYGQILSKNSLLTDPKYNKKERLGNAVFENYLLDCFACYSEMYLETVRFGS